MPYHLPVQELDQLWRFTIQNPGEGDKITYSLVQLPASARVGLEHTQPSRGIYLTMIPDDCANKWWVSGIVGSHLNKSLYNPLNQNRDKGGCVVEKATEARRNRFRISLFYPTELLTEVITELWGGSQFMSPDESARFQINLGGGDSKIRILPMKEIIRSTPADPESLRVNTYS